jgi:hypothetical protein
MGWVKWHATAFGVKSMHATPFAVDQLKDKGFVLEGTEDESRQKYAAMAEFKSVYGGKKLKPIKGRFKERGRRTW